MYDVAADLFIKPTVSYCDHTLLILTTPLSSHPLCPHPLTTPSPHFLLRQMLPQPKVAPNLAKITIVPEDSLQLLEELGSGAFGTVYKGYWQPEGEEHQYTVAIKVLNTSSPEANQELLEVKWIAVVVSI